MKKMVFFLALLSANLLFAQTAVQPSGSGTPENPYQIATLDHLAWVSQHSESWNMFFIQTADIDALATSTWNYFDEAGYHKGWLPIGNYSTPFTGSYNGGGHFVDGLYFADSNLCGFFGIITGATISNLGITNTSMRRHDTRSNAGGLVAIANNSDISKCYTTGIVFGGTWIGGFAGRNNGSTITNCFSRDSVYMDDHDGGGFVGNNDGIIRNCYVAGKVRLRSEIGGGFTIRNGGSVLNTFWDKDVSYQSESDGGTAKTSAEMKTLATFTDAGWDFVGETTNGANDDWAINNSINDGYPYLVWNRAAVVTTQAVTDVKVTTATGNGTITDLGAPCATQHGVCWNTSGTPTINDSRTQQGTVSATGTFTSNISGLTALTKYYVRAYVTNATGTNYGAEVNFTTNQESVDPDGRFVTGGGWIMSPPGAFPSNKNLAGKANFGFEAKYKKGSTEAEGNVEFQFKAGNLNFKSGSLDAQSLIISGSKAIFYGKGTINNVQGYTFLVSVIDGDMNTKGSPDKFRIKIWNTATGVVVYDNQKGADDNVEATTSIGGGTIVIHKSGEKSAIISNLTVPEAGFRAYPNPFHSVLHFEFIPEADTHALIELTDFSGRKIQTIFKSQVLKEVGYKIDFIPDNLAGGIYFYQITLGEKSWTGKVAYSK